MSGSGKNPADIATDVRITNPGESTVQGVLQGNIMPDSCDSREIKADFSGAEDRCDIRLGKGGIENIERI